MRKGLLKAAREIGMMGVEYTRGKPGLDEWAKESGQRRGKGMRSRSEGDKRQDVWLRRGGERADSGGGGESPPVWERHRAAATCSGRHRSVSGGISICLMHF